jgi:hypothetical protein
MLYSFEPPAEMVQDWESVQPFRAFTGLLASY